MDLKEVVAAYHSMYEGKKKEDEKPKKWHDDDGDGISYEDGEVDGKFDKKKKKKKDDEDDVKEAIDFAADYFLEEGIEEADLDFIIEDVGLDDFVEFVNEERAARKARASAPSYKKVKASVDATDAAKKKAGKGEYSAAYKKKETDVTVYDDKPAKASVKKVKKAVAKTKVAKKDYDGDGKKESPTAEYKGSKDKAIKKAIAKKAPAKKAGLISKIGSAYKKGVERHKAARAKGKEPEKRVKEFGKGFASGVKDTVKFAGKVKKAVVGETLLALLDTLEEGAELDIYDVVVAYLIDEQIAEDFDSANKAMTSLSEELVDQILDHQINCLDEAQRTLASRMDRKSKLYDKTVKKAMQFARDEGEASGHARFNMSRLGREKDKLAAKRREANEGYQRDPERSKKDKTHSKQPDPSKDGFTGIGNMSINDIMKMNKKMKKEAKK